MERETRFTLLGGISSALARKSLFEKIDDCFERFFKSSPSGPDAIGTRLREQSRLKARAVSPEPATPAPPLRREAPPPPAPPFDRRRPEPNPAIIAVNSKLDTVMKSMSIILERLDKADAAAAATPQEKLVNPFVDGAENFYPMESPEKELRERINAAKRPDAITKILVALGVVSVLFLSAKTILFRASPASTTSPLDSRVAGSVFYRSFQIAEGSAWVLDKSARKIFRYNLAKPLLLEDTVDLDPFLKKSEPRGFFVDKEKITVAAEYPSGLLKIFRDTETPSSRHDVSRPISILKN